MNTYKFSTGKCLSIVAMVLMLASLTSCVMYHPQVVQAPLIHEKGQLQMNASVGFSPMGGDAYLGGTVTYGATDWLAVQAHGNWGGAQGGYMQAAVGGYKSWGNAVLEGYLGYGFGLGHWEKKDSADVVTRLTEGRYHLPFAQCNFGWAGLANDHIDIGVAFKVGGMFPNITDNKLKDGTILTCTSPALVLEPQFFFRAGGPHLKWTLDIGYSHLLGGSMNDSYFFGNTGVSYTPITIITGITYDLYIFRNK